MKTLKELLNEVILRFPYGSSVYDTTTDLSDNDIICIVTDNNDFSEYPNEIYGIKEGSNDYQFITEKTWLKMIEKHHIIALESMFLPIYFFQTDEDYTKMQEYRKNFIMDKWKIRQVISGICSNAWAKAHKKMTVEKDLDIYRGKKSLFHSLRLFDFGKQLGRDGKISNYSSANSLWRKIYEDPSEDWNHYKEIYKPICNKMRSEFVEYCSKPIDVK